MSYKILLFITRQPHLTPQQFHSHWEKNHIPLLQSIAGPLFPLRHTRHYISRPAEQNPGVWPAAVLVGSQEDFTYDGIAELEFSDEEAFKRFMGVVMEPEAAKRIEEDEERFSVRGDMRAVVLGGVSVTGGVSE